MTGYGAWVAYEPALVPPLPLMRREGIEVLEDWLRWGEEWSTVLRIYGGLGNRSHVLEIGCGLGRIAFALRYILTAGAYDGFDVAPEKIAFLQGSFHRAHPNFRFVRADVRNTYYNPAGAVAAPAFRFPYADASFDVVFAASVFTHMLPEGTARYFAEAARVLRPGGRFVASVFLLDHYERGRPRPQPFARSDFAFDHRLPSFGDDFAMAHPDNPEQMTAYGLPWLTGAAAGAGLTLVTPPLPGLWSGHTDSWVLAQDLLVLARPEG